MKLIWINVIFLFIAIQKFFIIFNIKDKLAFTIAIQRVELIFNNKHILRIIEAL